MNPEILISLGCWQSDSGSFGTLKINGAAYGVGVVPSDCQLDTLSEAVPDSDPPYVCEDGGEQMLALWAHRQQQNANVFAAIVQAGGLFEVSHHANGKRFPNASDFE